MLNTTDAMERSGKERERTGLMPSEKSTLLSLYWSVNYTLDER